MSALVAEEASSCCFALRIFCTTGMQYAAVFPLPVRALASMSLFSNANGMALLCTRVGLANPRSARALKTRVSSMLAKSENDALALSRRASSIIQRNQIQNNALSFAITREERLQAGEEPRQAAAAERKILQIDAHHLFLC